MAAFIISYFSEKRNEKKTYESFGEREEDTHHNSNNIDVELSNSSKIQTANNDSGGGEPYIAEDGWTRIVPGDKLPNQKQFAGRRILSLITMLVIEVGIPLGLYYGLQGVIGIVYALVVSGIPPVLYVLVKFIIKRKIDVLGVIIALSFILSGIVSIVSGDPRAAVIRDQAVGAVIGIMFLITLIPLRTKWVDVRPLTFIVAYQIYEDINYRWTDCDGVRQEQNILYWQWDHVKIFRKSMYTQSFLWGFFLVGGLVACVIMVQLTDLSINQIVMINTIIHAGLTAGVMVIVSTVFYVYSRRAGTQIGKDWTAENDFTEYYDQLQQQQQQQPQLEQESINSNHNNSNTVNQYHQQQQQQEYYRNVNDEEILLGENYYNNNK